MSLGDIVIVLGGFDNRVRDHDSKGEFVKGTLYCYFTDEQACVILENNDLWVGSKRDICLASEQE